VVHRPTLRTSATSTCHPALLWATVKPTVTDQVPLVCSGLSILPVASHPRHTLQDSARAGSLCPTLVPFGPYSQAAL
jgi:hypothetical protein